MWGAHAFACAHALLAPVKSWKETVWDFAPVILVGGAARGAHVIVQRAQHDAAEAAAAARRRHVPPRRQLVQLLRLRGQMMKFQVK